MFHLNLVRFHTLTSFLAWHDWIEFNKANKEVTCWISKLLRVLCQFNSQLRPPSDYFTMAAAVALGDKDRTYNLGYNEILEDWIPCPFITPNLCWSSVSNNITRTAFQNHSCWMIRLYYGHDSLPHTR
jgi:hypothetical protein